MLNIFENYDKTIRILFGEIFLLIKENTFAAFYLYSTYVFLFLQEQTSHCLSSLITHENFFSCNILHNITIFFIYFQFHFVLIY